MFSQRQIIPLLGFVTLQAEAQLLQVEFKLC